MAIPGYFFEQKNGRFGRKKGFRKILIAAKNIKNPLYVQVFP
jgi:hypothetical protein